MNTMKNTREHDARLNRRSFLTGGLGLVGGAGLLAPSARAGMRLLGSPGESRTLVLIQLTGGNDGLSTIVPHGDDEYHRARQQTHIDTAELHKIDDYIGFHPDLKRMHGRFNEGGLAVVQGVGYAGPNRSHFKSREIWHAADLRGRAAGDGWVGRLCDDAWAESLLPELTVHIGRNVPYALHSRSHAPVAFDSPEIYRWFGDRATQAALESDRLAARRKKSDGSVLGRLRRVMDDAQDSSSRIRGAIADYRTDVEYPASDLSEILRRVAALLDARLGTRVITVDFGGFDTHASQKPAHADLMRELDGALDAFMNDIARHQAGKDTVVMAFSEFGRRVQENGSAGTDHGKAGPVFLAGEPVRGGLFGEHPSLTDLDQGDLRFGVDFRQAYASVIHWLGGDPDAVLGAHHDSMPFLG